MKGYVINLLDCLIDHDQNFITKLNDGIIALSVLPNLNLLPHLASIYHYHYYAIAASCGKL